MHTKELLRVHKPPGSWFTEIRFRKRAVMTSSVRSKQDAQRLVDCWNALAGIPNPVAFMEAHKALVEAVAAKVELTPPGIGPGEGIPLSDEQLADYNLWITLAEARAAGPQEERNG